MLIKNCCSGGGLKWAKYPKIKVKIRANPEKLNNSKNSNKNC